MKMICSNKYIFVVFFLFVLGSACRVQAQVITTIADVGLNQGSGGDGNPAPQAEFDDPRGIAIDANGEIYIADAANNKIRKIDLFGNVTTIAGTGKSGFSGDGGLATKAELNTPSYVLVDTAGNVYISDSYNYRVRKINTAGIITTIAGNGKEIYKGDSSLATAASFDLPPYGLAFDKNGNLYIATAIRIRMVSTEGKIYTVAGCGESGYNGDGGLATRASSGTFTSIAFDNNGNMYLADKYYHCIRKVNTAGIINRYAGTIYINPAAYLATGDGGPAIDARMVAPVDIKTDKAGNLYIADQGDGRIRMINTAGIISTFAGNGKGGHTGDNGEAINAGIEQANGLTLDNDANVFFTEGADDIRFVFSGIVASAAQPIQIYPNPTFNGVFKALFASKYEEPVSIEIVNQAGQRVYKNTAPTNRYIEMLVEPTGVYYLYGKSAHGKWQDKVSVVRY